MIQYTVHRDGEPTNLRSDTHRGAINKMRDAAYHIASTTNACIKPGEQKDMLQVWDCYMDKGVAFFEIVTDVS